MELVSYLKQIYGYDTPIFIKDVRIGRKSKTAIREEFYRATKRGDLSNDGPGVYSLVNKTNELTDVVTFEKILEKKFMVTDFVQEGLEPLFVEGYYSGFTFLNMIGITEQVPAILEVTTNKTSSKKYIYSALGRSAIVRKARTEITFQNYKALQFFDMFYFLTIDEIKANKDLIVNYAKKNCINRQSFIQYSKLYGPQTIKKIVEGGIVDAFI